MLNLIREFFRHEGNSEEEENNGCVVFKLNIHGPAEKYGRRCSPLPSPHPFYRSRILGRNWDKSLKSFPPCYSLSPLLTDFTLSPLP